MTPRLRTTAAPLLLGLMGIGALAGCSAPADTGTDDAGSNDTSETGSEGSGGSGEYADGTYEAEGEYQSPNGTETVGVTLTLEGNTVTDVQIETHPSNPNTKRYQGQFAEGIADVVVGQNIDELQVDRVAGSSLTSGGFNDAVEQIKSEAAA